MCVCVRYVECIWNLKNCSSELERAKVLNKGYKNFKLTCLVLKIMPEL